MGSATFFRKFEFFAPEFIQVYGKLHPQLPPLPPNQFGASFSNLFKQVGDGIGNFL
jgi:hypothetical protein